MLMGLCASVHLDVVLSVLKRLETQLTDPAFPCNEQGSRVGVLHQSPDRQTEAALNVSFYLQVSAP